MTRDAQRAYLRQRADTGRLLEEIRWRELRALDDAVALAAADNLIELALRVPLRQDRRSWSGLAVLPLLALKEDVDSAQTLTTLFRKHSH